MTATLSRVRLELARTDGFPEGSERHGYEFIAPLDLDGHVSATAWHDVKNRCVITRFWGDAPKEHGALRHVGRGWHFDFGSDAGFDEPVFKLDRHVLAAGNYISVTEHDGIQRPFRVASVTALDTVS